MYACYCKVKKKHTASSYL